MNDSYQRLKNPMFDLLCFMHRYDNNGLDDPKFVRLLKNLRTNFNKLYLTCEQILHHERIKLDLEKNDLLQCQLIEYSYLKISTIWDLAYQVADKLLRYGSPPEKTGKYDALQERFEEYNHTLGFLQTSWYREINKIRNRVVHGGINVIPFYVDKTLMFNTYNENTDSVLPQCAIFTYKDGLKASAGPYFMYYIGVLYHYLCDFFAYVLAELKKIVTPIHDLTEVMHMFFRSDERWDFESLDEYNKLAMTIRNLPLTSQRDDYIASRLNVKRFYGEPDSPGYRANMVDSILVKYGFKGHWLDKNTLRIEIDVAQHNSMEEMNREICFRVLGFAHYRPNAEHKYADLSFN